MKRHIIQIADYALSLFRQTCHKNFITITITITITTIIIILIIIVIIIIIIISIFIISLVIIINGGPRIDRRGLEWWA